ncbi:MAG: stage 0 sporulation protein, partial [Lachnospiraceae bacterium]|nr:stage 0 sporulation protein [Lachnospiraceae bacterium]
MVTIIGVRFKDNGRVYYFDPGKHEVVLHGGVIVETARGVEYGEVVFEPKQVTDDQIIPPLKPIIRVATDNDLEKLKSNKLEEKKAFNICQEKIEKHGLNMKLIDSEYTFDRSKLLFYFFSDKRIDFRELVKDLASVFHTRIELRQIGVRDETKLIGGYGICGRPFCCTTFLTDFSPVSIKMAKDQG